MPAKKTAKPPKRSAGILVYRTTEKTLQFLLVHPGGPFWRNKDAGAWSIPKGEYLEGEDPLAAAIRELGEETGFALPPGEFIALGELRQPSGKRITGWAREADLPADEAKSNLFSLEWPPRSGRMQAFPEVDKAAWFDAETARAKLIAGQREFLDRLLRKLDL